MAINFTLNIDLPEKISYQKFFNLVRPLFKAEAPTKPIKGPVRLVVIWGYKGDGSGPEMSGVRTDAISWLIKAFMRETGFWLNNMQVYDERIIRKCSSNPGITVSVQYGEDLEGDGDL